MRQRGLVTLILSIGVALGSAWIVLTSVHTYCEERPRLTVLATLAAFVIALSFRQLGTSTTSAQRWLLGACIALSATTLFADARVVIRYGHLCTPVEKSVGSPSSQPSK